MLVPNARHLAVHLIISTALLALSLGSGCSPQRSTVVIRDPDPAGLPPLSAADRGEFRREALRAARAGWEAFEADDSSGMERYFSSELFDSYEKRREEYSRQGRQRHRSFEVRHLDAVWMSEDGTQVTVRLDTIDHSYFIEPDGSRTETDGEPRPIELSMERGEDGGYRIVRMIAAAAALE